MCRSISSEYGNKVPQAPIRTRICTADLRRSWPKERWWRSRSSKTNIMKPDIFFSTPVTRKRSPLRRFRTTRRTSYTGIAAKREKGWTSVASSLTMLQFLLGKENGWTARRRTTRERTSSAYTTKRCNDWMTSWTLIIWKKTLQLLHSTERTLILLGINLARMNAMRRTRHSTWQIALMFKYSFPDHHSFALRLKSKWRNSRRFRLELLSFNLKWIPVGLPFYAGCTAGIYWGSSKWWSLCRCKRCCI